MNRSHVAASTFALAALSVCGACACSPAKPPTKPDLPPLETSSLAAASQGPGARWVVVARPKEIAQGDLGALLAKMAPAQGIDRLSKTLGFDARAVPDAIFVGYSATTIYAAHLPQGASPADALDAFKRRALPPSGEASPRPDLVRTWGSMPSGSRASLAAMWSSRGDAIFAESGRFGPVPVSIALVEGKLSPARGLAKQAPFDALLAWATDAPIAAFARCPLNDVLASNTSSGSSDGDKSDVPVVAQECDGAGLSARSAGGGKVLLSMHVTGKWGKDATLAEKDLAAAIDRVVQSDLGHALGLRDANIETSSSAEAVDARVTVDGATLAEGLRRLTEASIADVLR
jgi:hypothetical protein